MRENRAAYFLPATLLCAAAACGSCAPLGSGREQELAFREAFKRCVQEAMMPDLPPGQPFRMNPYALQSPGQDILVKFRDYAVIVYVPLSATAETRIRRLDREAPDRLEAEILEPCRGRAQAFSDAPAGATPK